jgi:hypothetical protein
MNSTSNIASALLGVVAAAFGIWLLVQIVNDRRKTKIAWAALIVGACLWLPFSWLVLMPGGWPDYRMGWLRMWPILPGLVPGAYLFHPHDVLEFSTMGITTFVLSAGLIRLGCRGWRSLIAAAAIALLISIPTACIAYAFYCA